MFKSGQMFIVAASLLLSGSIFAQDSREVTVQPVVVTATRIETPEEEVGKTVTVITAKQLQHTHAPSLVEALRNIPGVQVRPQGGPGAMTSFKIRGLDSEYTQILINGLPMSDPSDPQGAAVEFMNDVLVENIERIEIVRGSSSTLYGSDSVGGTINIITKKGSSTTSEVFGSFEGGSFATYQEVVGAQGAYRMVNYALTGKRLDSDGLDEHDTYGETAVSARLGIDFSPTLSVTTQMKYSDAEGDLNNTPGISEGVLIPDADDVDDAKTRTLLNTGISLTHNISNAFDYSVKLSYVKVDREFTFGPEGDEYGYGSETTYAGNIFNADLQANYSLNDTHLLTAGYEYEFEQFEQILGERKDTPDAYTHAVYLQDSLSFLDDLLKVTPGIRYENHDQAGSRVDWEISASYRFGESGLRGHGHVGTGFRAPSLYELYGASVFGEFLYEFGNPDLEPEDSLGWDVGLEAKTFDDALQVDLTYFRNTFETIIGFGAMGYENIDGGESQGLEFQAEYRLFDSLIFGASYTYTTTEDANGDAFYGVPEHEFGGSLTYQFLQKFNANLAVTFHGEEDIPLYDALMMQSERYRDDGFTKVDVGAGYVVTPKINLWARVENLLDEEYTVGGYTAPGRSFFGGIKVAF